MLNSHVIEELFNLVHRCTIQLIKDLILEFMAINSHAS